MEIERKFLIKSVPDLSVAKEVCNIEQAYLEFDPIIRIRKKNDEYIMTYKKRHHDIKDKILVNDEIEIPLTKEIYDHLMIKRKGNKIVKTRYIFPIDNIHKIELDIFGGKLDGLKLAEVEFSSIDDANSFIIPDWFGKDVSKNIKYNNDYLSKVKKGGIYK